MDQTTETLIDSQLKVLHSLRMEVNEAIRSLLWAKTRARTQEAAKGQQQDADGLEARGAMSAADGSRDAAQGIPCSQPDVARSAES